MAVIQQIKNGEFVDTSASTTSLSSSNSSTQAGGALDKDAFLQLLVAQMQYQDPLEPTDNTEYISQLATFSSLEEMQNINQSMTEGNAYSLVGKHVFVKVTSDKTGETFYDHGMVEYIMRENGKVYVSVNDSLYNIEDLDTVADSDYYNATTVAKAFTDMVATLPKESQLTILDESKLQEAREVYDSMTDYQKTFVSKEALSTLESLEKKLNEMKENVQSGSSEDGDDKETEKA
ncbi:MAG: flagellar hook assembly protein FlgD [Lachnospiraceae bacterium]